MRIEKLQKKLKEWNVDAVFIEDPISLFYLTGLKLSKGHLLVGSEVKLLVDGRYILYAKKSGLPTDLWDEKIFKNEIKDYQTLGFDKDVMTFASYQNLQKLVGNKELKPISSPLKDLRKIKDEKELYTMQKAADLTWKAYQHVKEIAKEGMTEKDLALEFEVFVRRNGADKLSFDPIIAFGKNSAMPHHFTGDTKLKNGDIVLLDAGVFIDHYASDMTRCFFFGEKDPVLEKRYKIAQEAQKNALSVCRPGTKLKHLDLAAREVFKNYGVEELYVHNLGHGVGLQIHEYPRIRFDNQNAEHVLEENMVITIEPGIYEEGIGGVRYEDMILITKDGFENMYKE